MAAKGKGAGRKDSSASSKSKTRKSRSDQTVDSFEKKYGLPPGTIRNKDGRDTRSDKKIGTIRKEKQTAVMTTYPRPPKKK